MALKVRFNRLKQLQAISAPERLTDAGQLLEELGFHVEC